MNKRIQNNYFNYLTDSYNNASKEFFDNDDFFISQIQSSVGLFTEKSLNIGIPKPKKLEVYALLSGLSFENKMQKRLLNIQNEINALIPEKLKYFVKPENLGLEHCVFKWPNEKWDTIRRKN